MKYLMYLFLATLFLDSAAYARPFQDDESDQEVEVVEEVTPKSQLKEIKSDLMDGIRSLSEEYYTAESDDEKAAVVAKRRKMEKEAIVKALDVYRDNDNEKVNVRSMSDLARQTKGDARRMLLETAVELHADAADIKRLMSAVGREPAPENIDFLVALQNKSTSDETKAWADYYHANHAIALRELSEERKSSLAKTYGESYLKLADSWAGEEGEARVLSLLERCEKSFAEVETDNQMLKTMVASARAGMKLAVGKVAPDIVGEDLDGVAFKLSDYRGKVVMLDFWGDW